MSLVERLETVTKEKLEEVANEIEAEMKAIVAKRSSTGRESKITNVPEGDMARFVGTTDLGLYYLDQGNGGSGSTIYPRVKRAMAFDWKGQYWVRKQVSGYDGIHFVREVADRHR